MKREPATRTLAEFLVGLTFTSLPAPAVDAAKTFTLDLLGCGLGAVATTEVRIAVEHVRELGGKEECSVVGFPLQTSCQQAAFANSLIAHVLELDDTHRGSITHIGAPVIPAALAMAERQETDGRTFLTAVVVGYEAALRVANAVQPSHWRMGFLGMGPCGTLGAAAAAAHCLGLDADGLANAFGLAGVQAAGINSSIYAEGDMGKRLVPSRAAANGTVAAMLAAKGFTGTTDILEGKFGFCDVFSNEHDLSRITEGLGEDFEILHTSLKPYSCCRYYHAPIDGLSDILNSEDVKVTDIAAIWVRTYDIAVTDRPHRIKPKSVFDAQMSMPFSLAVAAFKGKIDEGDITEKSLDDPALQALAAKVTVEADAAMTAAFPADWPADVRVETTDGRNFERHVAQPKGEPEAPMSPAEVEAKFLGLATEAMPKTQARSIIETVAKLDTAPGLGPLCELLRGPLAG
ncbi:MAG: MmgE/PrpD family protein [Rhodospirillales bacterium]|jgi:2-methylcitrate dehydratase PrpD|nr:MmgE/PrpD family protein [Rhodospirillales bacterium]